MGQFRYFLTLSHPLKCISIRFRFDPIAYIHVSVRGKRPFVNLGCLLFKMAAGAALFAPDSLVSHVTKLLSVMNIEASFAITPILGPVLESARVSYNARYSHTGFCSLDRDPTTFSRALRAPRKIIFR